MLSYSAMSNSLQVVDQRIGTSFSDTSKSCRLKAMARLFISYKREEQAYAFALRQWLIDKQDWPSDEVFVDRDKLHAGDAWVERIFREAEACEAMLFLASEASLKPESFCYRELQRARGVTIAVTLGGLKPEDGRLRSALPHGADARQIAALDQQPTDAFSYVSPIDGSHGAIALNSMQVESIGQTLRDLGVAPNSFTWKANPDGPYRGLGALQEGDEAPFYGREREIRDCMRILEEIRQSVSDRALLIQAPSGAGKSSLLRAGLWRRLRRHAGFSPLAIVRTRQGVLTHVQWGLCAGLARPEANLLNLPLGLLEERVSQSLAQLLTSYADADASRKGGRRTMLLGIDQAEEIAGLASATESQQSANSVRRHRRGKEIA
jgi:TIR domain